MSDIPFTQIPANNKVPFYFVEFDSSNSGVAGGGLQNSLLIGQTVNAQPVQPVYVPSAAWAANQFGAGSHLALMAAAYYQGDLEGILYALPLADDGSATQAEGNFSFVGPATAAGTLYLMVAGREVAVGVASGTAATAIATAVAAAIIAYRDANGMALPVTAAVDGTNAYQVNIIALNGGAVGNAIPLGLNYFGSAGGEATPAGVTVTVTAMVGGATDPSFSGVAAALGTTSYDFIALAGYTGATQLNAMQALMSFASGRWSYSQQLFGHVWTAYRSSGFSGSDLLTFGATRNDPHMTVIGYEAGVPNTPFEIAAGYMGAFAQAAKADPARPSQTLLCPNILPAPAGSRFGFATLQALLSTGIALMQPSPGGTMEILRTVTTYQLNSWSQPDASYLDAETLFILMFYVRDQKANLTQKFPRAKLAQDGTSFGQMGNLGTDTPSIVTPKVMKAELVAEYARMCPGGDLVTIMQDPTTYAAGLQCQINGANPNRLDILDDPVLIGGLRMIAVLNQFRLTDNPAGAA
jgi:phage tail sheath gpL-like